MKTILAMGAHFDDVEIGVGGTLFKHVDKGNNIYIAVLETDEYRTGDSNVRVEEQYKALNVLGIPKKNLIGFSSISPEPNIISTLDKLKPDIIYTSYDKDTHQAHRRCSTIGQAVGRKKHITTMFYGGGSSYCFNPQLFSVIDFEKKTNLLGCFETQAALGAIDVEAIKSKESYWASLVSTELGCYAEGFIIRKMKLEV